MLPNFSSNNRHKLRIQTEQWYILLVQNKYIMLEKVIFKALRSMFENK